MRERHRRGESTVLIIDEVQSLPLELLEEIRLLANIETNDVKLLSVVLAGQPELAARLNDSALRQLKQRIALRCELGALSLTETLGYVAGRIAAAGGTGAQIFTREAVMLIHERSRGIPRAISVIADNALVSGFALGRRPVTRAVVEEVCQDLDLRSRRADAPALSTESPERVEPAAPPALPAASQFRNAPVSSSAEAAGPLADADITPAPGNDADANNAAADGTTDGKLFSNMYPKRSPFRFFSFTRQG